MKSLHVLQRLARQAVDQERQGLQAIDGEIEKVERDLEGRRQAIEREASASLDFMTSGVTLKAFLKAGKARVLELEDRLAQLRKAHDIQLQRVRKERIEEKRFERLIDRRAKQAMLEAAAKEQKTIDDLVAMRTKRRS